MKNSKVLLYITFLVSVIGMSGCVSLASKDAMIAHGISDIQQHQKTVVIKTQGGGGAGEEDSSRISNDDFAKAIEASIIEHGLFTQVVYGKGSDFLISANIINLTKPIFGASFTVEMEAAWSLSDPKSKKIFMRESIKSSHTATMDDALFGPTRARLAVEGAARENIRLGIKAISKLQLE